MNDQIKRLIALLNEILKLTQGLRDSDERFRKDLEKLEGPKLAEAARKFAAELADDLAKQEQMLKDAVALAEELGKQEPPSPSPGPVGAGDFAKHFRSVIDAIQLDARKPQAGEVATTLKGLDVELKGLIVVEQNEARIVTPAPNSAINPAHLSTVRMSFGSIPLVRTETETPPTQPTQPSQPPDQPPKAEPPPEQPKKTKPRTRTRPKKRSP